MTDFEFFAAILVAYFSLILFISFRAGRWLAYTLVPLEDDE